MAYLRSGGVLMTEGGGGGTTPTFTETLICDNSSLSEGNLTFDYDYNDYDFLRFEIYNPDNSTTYYLITLPEIINNIKTRGYDYISIQPTGLGWVCTRYTISNDRLTWTRITGSNRQLIIKNVYGIVCDNMTVTKDEIYNRPNSSSSAVTIEPVQSLWGYSMIFFSAVNDSYDENMPCYSPLNIGIGQALNSDGEFFAPFNRLSGNVIIAYIKEHSITNNAYIGDVFGVKFEE